MDQQQSGQYNQPLEDENQSCLQRIKAKCLPGVKITLLISLILYIASFGIGIWGVHRCPVEDNIPFFLIVTGGIGVVSKIISIIRDKLLAINDKTRFAESVLYTVEIVFLLLGSFWVFKVYKPSFEPSSAEHYCNKTVYMFAFTYLIILYSMFIVMILGFCCFLGCMFCVAATNIDADVEAQREPMR